MTREIVGEKILPQSVFFLSDFLKADIVAGREKNR